jgi:hypothetical protein
MHARGRVCRDCKRSVLIATNALARGIDVPGNQGTIEIGEVRCGAQGHFKTNFDLQC